MQRDFVLRQIRKIRFLARVSISITFFPISTVLASGLQPLHGHVPAVIGNLPPLGEYAKTNHLHLAISLPLRNQAALSNLLAQIYNPASPFYRHYLTPEQFAAEFGPSEHDYQSVVAFANANGLHVTRTWNNRVLVDVEGSVADIERALHTTLKVYQHPTENRIFYAPTQEPSLDLSVPILHISGLDNFELPRSHGMAKPIVKGQKASPDAGSGPNGEYMGGDFRAAYVPDSSLNGSGQSVGLFEFDGYLASDISSYESNSGLPNVPLQNVLIDGASGNQTGNDDLEPALDIEMVVSMATNLSRVLVYIAPAGAPFEDILNEMAASNQVKQFSCCWFIAGGSSQPAADQIWEQMAAQGQSFFNASGDDDAYTGLIWFPSDSPYITQVGGTTLTTSGPGGAWVSESVWNRGGGIGSAGGVSTQYSIPSWQTNISMAVNQGSTIMRNMPDVAMTADNIYLRLHGGNFSAWGTSASAPLWAGFAALVNQQAAADGNPPIGLINAAVDAIGTAPGYGSAFHDITTGNNTSPNSPNAFYAQTGYDLCTGWGTPAGQALINALATTTSIMRPSLAIVSASNGLYLSWPTNSAGFVLVTTTNLASGNWTPVTTSLLPIGTQFNQPIIPTGNNAFYRLKFIEN